MNRCQTKNETTFLGKCYVDKYNIMNKLKLVPKMRLNNYFNNYFIKLSDYQV